MTNLKKVQSKVTDERVHLSYEKGSDPQPFDVKIVKVDANKITKGDIQADGITIHRMPDE